MLTQSGEFEDGAEVYSLSDEDLNHNFAKDFFPDQTWLQWYTPLLPHSTKRCYAVYLMPSIQSPTTA